MAMTNGNDVEKLNVTNKFIVLLFTADLIFLFMIASTYSDNI